MNDRRRAFWQTNGYVTGLTALVPAGADPVRAEFDALAERVGSERARVGLLDRHFDEPFIWRIATFPPILDAVESVLGPDVLLLATHFFCKYGRDGKWVAWHQDVTYWSLDPPIAVTAWYAVDDSDLENGCMRVIPGSHVNGVRMHGTADAADNLLSVNQEIPVSADEEARAVDLPLAAGYFSLHDGLLIHGSLPNLSDRRRCGLTLRFVPANVRQTGPRSTGSHWRAVRVIDAGVRVNCNSPGEPESI